MSGQPYADAAPGYLAAGWQGVLPVGRQPARKHEPPTGYTGRDGAWPTPEQVDAWRHELSGVNIALRLPRGVVGIDVDAYDGKQGADTMAAGAAAHGKLPATWTSTSRDDRVSGIRLFRVPADAEYHGELAHPERPEQKHVELIQHHHRYAVVAPSVHPEGRTYRWIAPDGTTGSLPRPDELPELPQGWRDHLARTCACYVSARAPLVTITGSGDAVADRLAAGLEALRSPGSRHDGVLGPVLALVGFRNRGSADAARALEDLHAAFLAAVTAPGTSQRSHAEAEREWHRMTEQGRAGTAGAGEPPWEDGRTSSSGTGTRPEPLEHPAATPAAWPEPLEDAAYHGVAGELVRAVAPITEADPVALLSGILVTAGALFGRYATLYQGSSQAANLYVAWVGDSATARKGTAGGVVRTIFGDAVPGWEQVQVPGLGSGEGLIARLTPKTDKHGDIIEPVPDHRALVTESEFGRLLAVMGREGSTLSPTLRDGWDGTPLGRFLAREEALVLWHHVAVLAHVTPAELRDKLTSTDAANGFGNRFLWLAVRRSHLEPFPANPRPLVAPYLPALRQAVEDAQRVRELVWSPAAARRWEELYAEIAGRARTGLAGGLTSRAEAQLARIALVYALLDRSEAVEVVHLEAASALWDYARRSAVYIFGESTGNRHADHVLRLLRAGHELDRQTVKSETGLRFGADLDAVEAALVDAGLAESVELPRSDGRAGRPRRVLRLRQTDLTELTAQTAYPARAGTSTETTHDTYAVSPVRKNDAKGDAVARAGMSVCALSPVRSDADPGEGTAVHELPPFRVVTGEPPELPPGEDRPPCFADPDLYRAHQFDHYNAEAEVPGCHACEGVEVPA